MTNENKQPNQSPENTTPSTKELGGERQLFMQYIQAWQQMPPEKFTESTIPEDDYARSSWPDLIGAKAREFKVDLGGNANTEVALVFWNEGGHKYHDGKHAVVQRFGIVISESGSNSEHRKFAANGEPVVATTYSFLNNGTVGTQEERTKVNDKYEFDRHDRETTPDDLLVMGELLTKLASGDIKPSDGANGALSPWGPLGGDGWQEVAA